MTNGGWGVRTTPGSLKWDLGANTCINPGWGTRGQNGEGKEIMSLILSLLSYKILWHTMVALSGRELPPRGGRLGILPVFESSFLREEKKKQQIATDPSLMCLPVLPGGC